MTKTNVLATHNSKHTDNVVKLLNNQGEITLISYNERFSKKYTSLTFNRWNDRSVNFELMQTSYDKNNVARTTSFHISATKDILDAMIAELQKMSDQLSSEQ